MSEATTAYEADFYAWLNEQAALLRAGRLSVIDAGNIAEELESMGKSQRHELISRLTVLLTHLLKWQFQPRRRSASWRATIRGQRDDLADHLLENPSLKAVLSDATAVAYRKAKIAAEGETRLSEATFPATCPWSWDQVIDEGFWPGAK